MWSWQDDDRKNGDASSTLPGVVDTIGTGYEALIARPQLILLPVLVDLYFWLGVHITAGPLLDQIVSWLRNDAGAPDGVVSDVEGLGITNLHELVALWLPTVHLPSFVSMLSADTSYRLDSWRPSVVFPWWGIIVAAVLLFMAGLIIGSTYLSGLASATAQKTEEASSGVGRSTIRGSLRLAGWIGVIIAIVLLATWPVLAGAATFSFLDAGVSIWFLIAVIIPILWGFVFFFFSIQAMFVDRVGPLPALRSSYLVVRSDTWRSLGLIVAYLVVVSGFPQVWRLMISQPAGLAIAIVGHAIIGTGMIAATMVFYQDRARALNIAGCV